MATTASLVHETLLFFYHSFSYICASGCPNRLRGVQLHELKPSSSSHEWRDLSPILTSKGTPPWHQSRSRSTGKSKPLRSARILHFSGCCVTRSASQARSLDVAWLRAAPAPCFSTETQSARASLPSAIAKAKRSSPSKASPPTHLIRCKRRGSKKTFPNADTVIPARSWRRQRSFGHIQIPLTNKSMARCRGFCADAEPTRGSGVRSIWRLHRKEASHEYGDEPLAPRFL